MLLVVGRIGRAHGIRGEATIEVRTDDPDSRLAVGAILQTEPAKKGPLTIASGRVHNGTLLLSFAGIPDRTAVEKLRDVLLIADVDVGAESDGDDSFHISQIIGCEVYLTNGVKVGIVSDVLSSAAQDTLVVTANGIQKLIPFVDEIVPDVDITNRRIVITPPEGLL